jgi:uncharacterized protein DUF4331
MGTRSRIPRSSVIAFAACLAFAPAFAPSMEAASHREAPAISLDPAADITDFFMFRSYEPGKDDRIVLIMDVFPGGEPSSGPNYFRFAENVLYAFHVDNNRDGLSDDVEFEFRFSSEIRGVVEALGLFLDNVALPPITTLDGPGSEGLGLRQSYTVTMVRNGHREQIAHGLFTVPSNVGPRTTPGYDGLAGLGIYTLTNGIRVFAGQRGDPFYIDLGATFDTLNFRRSPPLLTAAEDANDAVNPFGIDSIGTFNVQTIAIEVPAAMLTVDGRGPAATAQPKLGGYASTARSRVTVLGSNQSLSTGPFVQVQRLANPLVNEAIIGTKDKDRWNATEPETEAAFVDYYLNPRLALALQVVFGVPAATSNRTDLRDLLLKYQPGDSRLSELLRLDIGVLPTPLASQRRMTVLAAPPDPAGWPNGRRPKDDVTDIAVRVVGGPNYIGARAGDGVNANFGALGEAFPFLATPQNGRDRVHNNP